MNILALRGDVIKAMKALGFEVYNETSIPEVKEVTLLESYENNKEYGYSIEEVGKMGAYYDPRSHSISIRSDFPIEVPLELMLMHELIHSLQDRDRFIHISNLHTCPTEQESKDLYRLDSTWEAEAYSLSSLLYYLKDLDSSLEWIEKRRDVSESYRDYLIRHHREKFLPLALAAIEE